MVTHDSALAADADITPTAPAKPLGGLHRWLRGLFIAQVVGLALMAVGQAWFMVSAPDSYDVTVDMLPADWVLGAGGIIYLPVFIVTIVLFCVFTYRALKNLHGWGAKAAEMAPGWAVGSYFVPIANLFVPYRGMDQIRDGSAELLDSHVEDSRLGLWWGSWVIGSILDRVSTRLDGGFTEVVSIEMQRIAAGVGAVSSVLILAAALILLPVLGDITRRQDGYRLSHTFD